MVYALVYKKAMRFHKLISSGLLVAVLLAPVLGMALCATTSSAAKVSCKAHCAMMAHAKQAGVAGTGHHAPAPVKAPCCERKAPTPAVTETAAQIVAPVQIALLDAADASVALRSVAPAARVEIVASPPPLAPPLSLLCTLLI